MESLNALLGAWLNFYRNPRRRPLVQVAFLLCMLPLYMTGIGLMALTMSLAGDADTTKELWEEYGPTW